MGQPHLELIGLCKHYGATPVLHDVSLAIAKGEFVCLLGPSGCGKTTLLMCLAGLERPSTGTLRRDGQDITDQPAADRHVGIVFQSYALFPNLSVADNIAFGLVNAGTPKARTAERVRELLALLGLETQAGRFPSQISGGQQQRVALARALAVSPSLLLLDEPLSALDAQVRARLRVEIRELQRRLGLTTVMVTHDQEEAQTMADRIVVMHQGCIQQVGTPWEVYDAPQNPFVAEFIGVANMLPAVVTGAGQLRLPGGQALVAAHALGNGVVVQAMVRPEDIGVTAAPTPDALPAAVRLVEPLGASVRLHLQPQDSGLPVLKADMSKRDFACRPLAAGDAVHLSMPTERLRVYPC